MRAGSQPHWLPFGAATILQVLLLMPHNSCGSGNGNGKDNMCADTATYRTEVQQQFSFLKRNRGETSHAYPSNGREVINLKDVNITAILDSLQTGYDKRIRPNYGGSHVDVGITMHILSISSLSEVQMDFTLDFYFRQHWTDPRLCFPDRGGLEELTVGSEYLSKIWVPDTFFANEKKSYFHMATTSNEMLRITNQGKVLRSMRLTITASCPMNLQYFPMDRQLCIIEIESFAYSMDHIRLSWHAGDKSVVIESNVNLPQFRVLGYNRRTIMVSTSTGNYSRLLCEIMFVRSMGYYLIQIYIPSSLIVVISWVSFWLNRSATPARVSLGVTTVLTMTTLMSSTNAALPKISYVKSIDVYLGTCFVMVFASLLEYAAVGYMGKRIQMRKNRIMTLQKLAEQRKMATLELSHTSQDQPDHGPKQTHASKQTEVRYKVHDPKAHSKGGTLENTINGRADEEAPPQIPGYPPHKDLNKNARTNSRNTLMPAAPTRLQATQNMIPVPPPPVPPPAKDAQKEKEERDLNSCYGCTSSDIDKYSRVIFPISFVTFIMMYWAIYLHISDDPIGDEVILHDYKPKEY